MTSTWSPESRRESELEFCPIVHALGAEESLGLAVRRRRNEKREVSDRSLKIFLEKGRRNHWYKLGPTSWDGFPMAPEREHSMSQPRTYVHCVVFLAFPKFIFLHSVPHYSNQVKNIYSGILVHTNRHRSVCVYTNIHVCTYKVPLALVNAASYTEWCPHINRGSPLSACQQRLTDSRREWHFLWKYGHGTALQYSINWGHPKVWGSFYCFRK